MYLLDPLESQLPSTSTASTSVQSLQGVAVGLGLMSNLTEFSEEIFVTGTVSKGQVGIDSLEVVFNLREVGAVFNPQERTWLTVYELDSSNAKQSP